MELIKESYHETKRWEDYDTIVCPDGTIVDMNKLLDEQSRAKAAVSMLSPFLGSLINKIRFVYTFHFDTQATDGYNIFVNPQFTNSLDFEGKVFVLAHELWHCILDHMRRGRQAGHDGHKSNIAADQEVNNTLVDLGIVSDSIVKKNKAIYDTKYRGWAYEQIYADNPKDPTQGNQSSKYPKNRQNQPSNSADGSSQSSDQGGDTSQGRGQGSQGVVRPEDCGGSFGDDQPKTPGTFMDRAEGKELAEKEGYNDAEGGNDSISQKWKDAVIKNIGKLRGDKAGSYLSKIMGIWNTSTDWKKILREIIGRSLNPADKRSAYANKNVLVSQNRVARTDKDKFNNVDYMVAFVDSSGSMSDQQLQLVLSEVYSIALKKKPVKFVVVQCDTKIQEIKEYNTPAEIKKDFQTASVKGRGGTELKPCWDLLLHDKKFNKRPAELCVVFTDGYLTQYRRNPKTMNYLVWCILDNPTFKLEYPEIKTKVIYLDTKDIK